MVVRSYSQFEGGIFDISGPFRRINTRSSVKLFVCLASGIKFGYRPPRKLRTIYKNRHNMMEKDSLD